MSDSGPRKKESSEVIFYDTHFGRKFKFNDPVTAIMCFPQIRGRLVQVRKKVGEWKSDQFLIRKADGELASCENVMLVPDELPLPTDELDDEDCEYTICGKFPETGFVIESPSQPPTPSRPFTITITKGT